MIKLSLGHCSFTVEIFVQLTCSSKINYFLLCAWISEILKYLMKSLETFRKWPIQYSLLKKLSLELAPIMLVLFQSLQDFTYIAFKGLLCINGLHSESHHIASKSFETFHTPPNDEVLMIKLSLGHCWFTAEIFLQWPVVLRSTTFFSPAEFLKFWNIWWNRLKLSTNDRLNIRCWKNLVSCWHQSCLSFSKVSKISLI